MITVIIPVYNVDQYLDQCLQSVYEQLYSDWECILVDDGSSDRSGEICELWSKKDSRFICIHQKNQGVSAARNHGIQLANGEFIVFVDSDDYISSDYLLNLIQGIISDDIDLVVGGFFRIYKNSSKEIDLPRSNAVIEMSNIYIDDFLQNIGLFYGPCFKLYKKKCIVDFAASFPEDLSLGEDILFNFQYLRYCNKIKLISCADYYYRMQEDGLCNKYRPDLFDCLFRIWNFRKEVMIKKNMWDKNVIKYFSLQLWGYTYDCLLGNKTLSYYKTKQILKMVDVNILKAFQDDFSCAQWIKYCFLHRCSLLIYIHNNIKKYGF